MSSGEWLSVIRREYLQDFVLNGGASVKFVIPGEDTEYQRLWEDLRKVAKDDGYFFAPVSAANTKVQMVDQIFHEVARQIPWDELAYAFLCTTLMEGSYLVPAEREEFSLSKIAYLNGMDLGEMRAVINNRLREHLTRDYSMTHEFRMAMLKLCQAQLDPQDLGGGVAEAVREWLTGDLRLISGLKSASIFQKIGRHNGRDMLSSLSHWLHITGKSGLVLALDISQFLETRRMEGDDRSLYYTPSAVVDGYEVLRQFVDSTDELHYCLLVVFAPPSFLTSEQRGVRKYDALYLRIWDEVRDRKRANPLSTLIRIEKSEEPASTEALWSRS